MLLYIASVADAASAVLHKFDKKILYPPLVVHTHAQHTKLHHGHIKVVCVLVN